ncbi:MAG TPA: allophanate hydrolase, partial [Chthoniobacterales bacterium]
SGRVPAAFNELIGFKPTVGRWSTSGLLPACRTLDCITVFTRQVDEAARVDEIVRGFDAADSFSRKPHPPLAGGNRIGILAENQREFFGDLEYARLYAEAIAKARALGWEVAEFDYEPFRQAANLLYSGPWVAERYAAIREFIEGRPGAIHPAVRTIIEGARKFTALDAFQSRYQLAGLARQAEKTWESFDAILLPTAGTIYTIDQMRADPIRLNTHLGHYTNFVNLLDLCAIAFPAGRRADGLPFGVTLIGPAWSDESQAALAAQFAGQAFEVKTQPIQLAVVGAHLRGLPLNFQLRELGARFVRAARTAPAYRLYALPNTTPPKPGLARTGEGGTAIELEIWELSPESFGRFVNAVPPPLAIGNVQLESGKWVKGFVCEPLALQEARDISEFGGWRAFLAAGK